MTENEDEDPVGEQHAPARDPHDAFRAIAERVGLVEAGEQLDPRLLAFATGVVDLCATIGDAYGDEDAGGNAGEHIRAVLYD